MVGGGLCPPLQDLREEQELEQSTAISFRPSEQTAFTRTSYPLSAVRAAQNSVLSHRGMSTSLSNKIGRLSQCLRGFSWMAWKSLRPTWTHQLQGGGAVPGQGCLPPSAQAGRMALPLQMEQPTQKSPSPGLPEESAFWGWNSRIRSTLFLKQALFYLLFSEGSLPEVIQQHCQAHRSCASHGLGL